MIGLIKTGENGEIEISMTAPDENAASEYLDDGYVQVPRDIFYLLSNPPDGCEPRFVDGKVGYVKTAV